MNREQAVDFLKNNPAKFGRLLGFDKLSNLHNDWIHEMVCGKEDKTLQGSRGTYKTTCVSIALAETIIMLPRFRTMFMRKTDTDVKEVIKQVQKILKDPHTLYLVQCIYGVNLLLTVETAFEVNTNLTSDIKGTNQLIGMGIGGSLTGKHYDRIFTDDIVNVKDRISKAEREQTKIIYQELQNIKNRGYGCKIFNTGTPWHEEDCFSIMPEAERYDCYHPEIRKIISQEELNEIKTKMLPSLFCANYELRFIASEDVIFTDPVTGGAVENLLQTNYNHIDASYGGEDYTAFTMCAKKNGKYYVFGKLWRKHVDDCMDEILACKNGLLGGRIYMETNADKGYLAKDARNRGERVTTYHEKMNKFIKITTYLKSVWKDVIFVIGTDDAYIKQITDYNENAEHDDAPDSLASIVRVLWGKSDEKYVSPFGG